MKPQKPKKNTTELRDRIIDGLINSYNKELRLFEELEELYDKPTFGYFPPPPKMPGVFDLGHICCINNGNLAFYEVNSTSTSDRRPVAQIGLLEPTHGFVLSDPLLCFRNEEGYGRKTRIFRLNKDGKWEEACCASRYQTNTLKHIGGKVYIEYNYGSTSQVDEFNIDSGELSNIEGIIGIFGELDNEYNIGKKNGALVKIRKTTGELIDLEKCGKALVNTRILKDEKLIAASTRNGNILFWNYDTCKRLPVEIPSHSRLFEIIKHSDLLKLYVLNDNNELEMRKYENLDELLENPETDNRQPYELRDEKLVSLTFRKDMRVGDLNLVAMTKGTLAVFRPDLMLKGKLQLKDNEFGEKSIFCDEVPL